MKKKPFTARYQEIAQTIMNDIMSGKNKIGEQLPSEKNLAETFQASRFTIRAAMDELQQKGMISRQRRLGTIVVADEPVELIVQEIQSVDDMFQYPENTRLRLLKSTELTADISLANFLQCDSGTDWMKMESIRVTRDDGPVCLTEIYVPKEFADMKSSLNHDGQPVFKMMEEKFGIKATQINAEVQAGKVTKERAKKLQVEPDSPSLIIVRRYRDNEGRLFEVSVCEHPASRFSYSFNMSYRR